LIFAACFLTSNANFSLVVAAESASFAVTAQVYVANTHHFSLLQHVFVSPVAPISIILLLCNDQEQIFKQTEKRDSSDYDDTCLQRSILLRQLLLARPFFFGWFK
jgi:hypothetical protein